MRSWYLPRTTNAKLWSIRTLRTPRQMKVRLLLVSITTMDRVTSLRRQRVLAWDRAVQLGAKLRKKKACERAHLTSLIKIRSHLYPRNRPNRWIRVHPHMVGVLRIKHCAMRSNCRRVRAAKIRHLAGAASLTPSITILKRVMRVRSRGKTVNQISLTHYLLMNNSRERSPLK